MSIHVLHLAHVTVVMFCPLPILLPYTLHALHLCRIHQQRKHTEVNRPNHPYCHTWCAQAKLPKVSCFNILWPFTKGCARSQWCRSPGITCTLRGDAKSRCQATFTESERSNMPQAGDQHYTNTSCTGKRTLKMCHMIWKMC